MCRLKQDFRMIKNTILKLSALNAYTGYLRTYWVENANQFGMISKCLFKCHIWLVKHWGHFILYLNCHDWCKNESFCLYRRTSALISVATCQVCSIFLILHCSLKILWDSVDFHIHKNKTKLYNINENNLSTYRIRGSFEANVQNFSRKCLAIMALFRCYYCTMYRVPPKLNVTPEDSHLKYLMCIFYFS